MSRTVVPSPQTSGLRAKGTSQKEASTTEDGDGLSEKLVKYVPAETLAFFIPAAAAIDAARPGLLIAALIISALGTVGYLWLSSRSLPKNKQPLLHFYFLAIVAFACWALATGPNVAALVNVDDVVGGLILGAAVFLIPLADGVLERLSRQRQGT